MLRVNEVEVESNKTEINPDYCDSPEALKELLNEVFIDVEIMRPRKRKDDKFLYHLPMKITVKRKDKSITFDFFGSHKDASIYDSELFVVENSRLNSFDLVNEQKKQRIAHKKGLVYDILCCIKLDGLSYYDNFDVFCDEFGYSNDSIKDLEIFNAVEKQKKLISSIFTQDELELFPY